jgi:hypothetical protein
MRTVWAQRREELVSDCLVSPDVFTPLLEAVYLHPADKSSMKTCVFTPPHETGILVADIIPYAGSHDTRLGRESSWPQVPSGTHFFSGR